MNMSTNATAAESARRELGGALEGELVGPDDPENVFRVNQNIRPAS
jgi:hypothetical protein